jgi:hypothetical protein
MFAFDSHDDEPDAMDVALELIDFHDKYPGFSHGIRPHLFKILFRELSTHTDMRRILGQPRLSSDLRPTLRLLRRKQIELFERYQADPAAFDWEGEIKAADIEAIEQAKKEKEREEREAQRLAAEEKTVSGMANVGTGQVNATSAEPPVKWAPPEKKKKKKFCKEDVVDIVDDGLPIEAPEGLLAFLRAFYNPAKDWYSRYQGRLVADIAAKKAALAEANKDLMLKKKEEKAAAAAAANEQKTCSDDDSEQTAKKQRVE